MSAGRGSPRHTFFGDVEVVDQFHDRGDGRVEVPASLEVVAYALDGLVKLALDFARLA